jgi:hypothetical protein
VELASLTLFLEKDTAFGDYNRDVAVDVTLAVLVE